MDPVNTQGGNTQVPEPVPAAPAAAPSPGAAPEPAREPLIPRERFDQVNDQLQALRAENAYYQEQVQQMMLAQNQAPASNPSQVLARPQQDTGMPQEHKTWEDWYMTDPGAATDYRTRRVLREEREAVSYQEGRDRFAKELYVKYPDIQDPVKRIGSPIYKELQRLVTGREDERALRNALELAELRVRSSGAVAAAQQAGAITEQQRQAGVAANAQPVGFQSPAGGGGSAAEPTLTPEQAKMAVRYGMTPKDYLASMGMTRSPNPVDGKSAASIPMNYERAKFS